MTHALAEKISANTQHYYRTILGLPDWQTRTVGRVDRSYEKYMYRRLLGMVGTMEGKTILDLGCGWGGVVLEASESAEAAFGIEPDLERWSIARELLASAGIAPERVIQGYGEDLPFPAAAFDVVVSYQVLEHVKDPERVMSEVSRILKPNGTFHFSTPNYLACWEPHYKIFWIPLMPKWLGRIYLRLRRRDPAFLAHLNYVHPFQIRSLLRKYKFEFRDLHEESATEKLKNKIQRMNSRFQPGSQSYDWFNTACRRFTFLVHTCFVNRDQEYLARKS
jgi:ubiquinone/menaquinone biosynthesis C-methylase UbiE